MSYLKGSGTQADPWVIHDAGALKYWFEIGNKVAGYAVLACDIDMAGVAVTTPYDNSWICNLDGYGHRIMSLAVGGSLSYQKATWQRIMFVSLSSTWPLLQGWNNTYSKIIDCMFDGLSLPAHTSYIAYTRCVARNVTNAISNNYVSTSCFTVDGSNKFSNFTDLRNDPDKYNPSKYPSLVALPELWSLDGASAPRLLAQDVAALIHEFQVHGITTIDNIPASRRVRAHAPTDFYQITQAMSGEDGSFQLNCGYYQDSVFVSASDDYGSQIKASTAYALNAVVHPDTPNGYRYVCTQAGTTDASLPAEPWDTEATLVSGTAQFAPLKVNQPIIHGPIKPVLIDLLTGEPV